MIRELAVWAAAGAAGGYGAASLGYDLQWALELLPIVSTAPALGVAACL